MTDGQRDGYLDLKSADALHVYVYYYLSLYIYLYTHQGEDALVVSNECVYVHTYMYQLVTSMHMYSSSMYEEEDTCARAPMYEEEDTCIS
jgi:hypothetical protein